MAMIETVAGPVEHTQLGRTLAHEQLLTVSEPLLTQFPHLYDREAMYTAAVETVRGVQAHGVRTIVDPCVAMLGRDVAFHARVAAETGVNLVVATGLYTYNVLPPYFQWRDADALADALVHDIEQGIQGTSIKAAFIKCATDEPGVTPDVEKVLRASARAHLRTGRPIMAHSHAATRTGLEQARIFHEEGVDLRAVQIAHTGDSDDLDYIERLLDLGVWIGMDRFGVEGLLPLERRAATVAKLCARGHAGRMMLSQDYSAFNDWVPADKLAEFAPAWSMTLLFETVLPRLAELGVGHDQIDVMLERNPAAWLSGS
ncbi:phosphotriesterase [Spongiactinospora sp. 9N601]|uniref:phosphotriesterase n=1 Tax=Spongiactinospora sp. 9N601 TaxID=3375149 RepID=UPI0037B91264